MSAPTPESHAPLFSVVVPTYERRESLERCLRALASQKLPRERFEVVVVDDGSARPPRDLVDCLRHELDVRLHEQRHAGPATARNSGAAMARGEYLVFTDDDCVPDPGWLTALAEAVAIFPGHAVGGRVHNALSDGLYSTASQLLIDFLYDYYNAAATDGHFFITSNLAFPTAVFRAIGGFDVTFPLAAAEDRDMCDRWREHGYQLTYCHDAIVEHAHALGFLSYCRQHFNYGRGAFHLHLARDRRGVRPLRIEPPHFYSRLVSYPISRAPSMRAVVLSALLGLSQVVYISGYAKERITHPTRVASKSAPRRARHDSRGE